jgi:hypothetical protein
VEIREIEKINWLKCEDAQNPRDNTVTAAKGDFGFFSCFEGGDAYGIYIIDNFLDS